MKPVLNNLMFLWYFSLWFWDIYPHILYYYNSLRKARLKSYCYFPSQMLYLKEKENSSVLDKSAEVDVEEFQTVTIRILSFSLSFLKVSVLRALNMVCRSLIPISSLMPLRQYLRRAVTFIMTSWSLYPNVLRMTLTSNWRPVIP